MVDEPQSTTTRFKAYGLIKERNGTLGLAVQNGLYWIVPLNASCAAHEKLRQDGMFDDTRTMVQPSA